MGFLDWLFGKRECGGHDERLQAAVDRVIAGTDPRLKAISGARERLTPAVAHALAYAQGAVARIPEGVDLTPENWSQLPLLRAFFTRPADVAAALSNSQDVRDFMNSPAVAGMETLHGVVAATRVERTVLGHAMQDGMLRQDVAQKTVSFTDLRIAGFTRSEAEVRTRLEEYVLEQTVLSALRDVAINRERSDQLGVYRQLLLTRLRLLEQGGGSIDSLLDSEAQEAPDLVRLRGELAANEVELNELRPANGIDAYLDALVEALHGAEEIIQPKLLTLRLNAMNIVASEGELDAADIQLVEFSTMNPDRPRRVGFLARFPRSAYVEKTVDLDALLRSL